MLFAEHGSFFDDHWHIVVGFKIMNLSQHVGNRLKEKSVSSSFVAWLNVDIFSCVQACFQSEIIGDLQSYGEEIVKRSNPLTSL